MKKMIFVLLTLLLLAACSTAVQQETQTQQPQINVAVEQKAAEVVQETQKTTSSALYRVRINNFNFMPESLTVNVGDTVVWENEDKVIHTVTANNKEFDSLSLKQDDEFAYTFTKKGTYSYNCDVHRGMTGSVKVE